MANDWNKEVSKADSKSLNKTVNARVKSYAKNYKKQEDDEAAQRKEQRKADNLKQAQSKKGTDLGSIVAGIASGAAWGGKQLVKGAQQTGGLLEDVALQGGDLVGELSDSIQGKSEAQKNKRRNTTQALRDRLHNQTDIEGSKIEGTSGVDESAGRVASGKGKARDYAAVAGKGLETGIGATMFANPGATAGKAALTGTKAAVKQAAKEAALFGGTDAAATTSSEYGKTGDVKEALKQGAIAGATSAALGGGGSLAGHAIGRVTDRKQIAANKIADAAQKSSEKQAVEALSTGAAKSKAREEGEAVAAITSATNPRYRELDNLRSERDARKAGTFVDNDPMDNAMRLENDPEYIKGRDEISQQMTELDDNLKQYNDYIVNSPYHRQVDKLDNDANKLDRQKQAELDQARQIVQDSDVTDPQQAEINFGILKQDIEERYSPQYAAIQDKHNKLAEKYPQDALEAPILHQSIQQASDARMQAQMALEKHQQDSMSRVSEQGATERNAARAKELDNEIAIREQELEDIKARKESPTTNPDEAQQKLDDLRSGNYTKDTHPELFNKDGTENTDKVGGAIKAANNEVKYQKKQEVLNKDPVNTLETPKSPEARELKDTALQDSLDNIKPMSWWDKVSAGILSNDEFLQSIGLNKLADKLETGITMAHRSRIHDRDVFTQWTKWAKDDSSEMLFRAADGNQDAYNALSDGGKKVVDSWQDYAKRAAEEQGLPLDRRITDYIPHMFGINNKTKFIPEEMLRILKKNDKGDVNARFLKNRTGAEGFEEDFWKAIEAYSQQKARKVHIEPVTQELVDVANTVTDKNLNKFLQDTADTMRGKQNELDKWMNDYVPGSVKGTRAVKTVLSAGALFGNVTSPINSMAQMANVFTEAGPKAFVPAKVESGKMWANVLKNGPESDPMFQKMREDGIFEGDVASTIKGNEDGKSLAPGNIAKKTSDKLGKAGYAMLQGVDRDMRATSYIAGYRKALAKNMTEEQARQAGRRAANRANFNFSRDRVPPLFRSQVAKNSAALVTFVAPMMKYAVDTGYKGIAKPSAKMLKGGKPTKEDIDNMAKVLYFVGASAGMSSLINGALSGGQNWDVDFTKVVPNPMDDNTYSTPALQLLTGTETQPGLLGAVGAGVSGLTRDGGQIFGKGNWTDEEKKTISDFGKNTFFDPSTMTPGKLIPGSAQYNKTTDAINSADRGYSTSKSGNIQFSTSDWDNNTKVNAALFGKYNTKEGREYLSHMNDVQDGKQVFPSLSPKDTERVMETDPQDRQEAIDFYKSAKSLTKHQQTSSEITQLLKDKRPRAAMRKAQEYNDRVDEALAPYYSKYPDMADELKEDLNKRIYINTKRIRREL